MPRRPAARRPPRAAPTPTPTPPPPSRAVRWVALGLGLVLAACTLVLILPAIGEGPAVLLATAQSAEQAGDWRQAREAYRAFNRTRHARGRSRLGEARACLAMDLAAQAEAALVRASEADPADPEPWRVRLEILRTEGRTTEAQRVGWEAYAAVAPGARRAILRELTLALLLPEDALADLPDDRSRARLDRWAAADPGDPEALVARHRRIDDDPRPGDPDLASWIATLEAIVARDPGRASAREALVAALDDLGETDRARAALDDWPASGRDARFERLAARLALDSDGDPARAASALERALAELPQDVGARARLARAYRALGRLDDASREAALAASLRERLDPSALVPRLASALARPDDPRARIDLADLAARAGLARLADAWRREGAASPLR